MMVEFVSGYKSSEVLKPTDGSFNFPSSFVASKFPSVLSRRFDSISFVRSNQICAAFSQTTSQRIAVGGSIIDQGSRAPMDRPIFEQRLNQIHFMRTGAFDQVATRRALAVCEQHDFRTFAAFGLTYTKPPFFAVENVPSAMDSSRSILPSRSSLLTKRAHAFLNKPDSVHFFSRRQHVGYDGKLGGKSRHRAPVRSTQAIASKHSREEALGLPPRGEGEGSSNKSEIRFHCSSLSSNSGSVLDPTEESACAEWDRLSISWIPFTN